ncbi:hypothetical protein LPTSP4_19480 [Leptospira ryugenii]|uniref:Uncharacterized protein n=1 Tax=Leptospira ryugenii TaxID=1917863 RepID=A0A2P2E0M0_9LEPT|nr:hypothetical protein LPTSP4_19480 [Leptospira ryugenii]
MLADIVKPAGRLVLVLQVMGLCPDNTLGWIGVMAAFLVRIMLFDVYEIVGLWLKKNVPNCIVVVAVPN